MASFTLRKSTRSWVRFPALVAKLKKINSSLTFALTNNSQALIEVERACAQTQRPGTNFWFAVNKPQARFSEKLKEGSSSDFKGFIDKKLGQEAGSG